MYSRAVEFVPNCFCWNVQQGAVCLSSIQCQSPLNSTTALLFKRRSLVGHPGSQVSTEADTKHPVREVLLFVVFS